MVNIFLDKLKIKENENKAFLKKIKAFLKKNNSCYVLITCSEPTNCGNMDVELAYEGDEDLVSYVMENAQLVFQNKENKSNDSL